MRANHEPVIGAAVTTATALALNTVHAQRELLELGSSFGTVQE
jgi:hypothetical protein